MTHSIAALGLSARPYFNRYTDDAIDLCDVLSSFTSQAKVTLHELCRILGLLGKPDNIDGGEVEKYFREGPAARGGGGARRRPQLRRRSIWSGWIVRSDGAARAPENDDDAGQEPRWRRRVGRRDVRDASRLCSSHIGRRRRSPRAPLTLCQLGNAFCHRYGTKSIPPTPNRSAAMSHGVRTRCDTEAGRRWTIPSRLNASRKGPQFEGLIASIADVFLLRPADAFLLRR